VTSRLCGTFVARSYNSVPLLKGPCPPLAAAMGDVEEELPGGFGFGAIDTRPPIQTADGVLEEQGRGQVEDNGEEGKAQGEADLNEEEEDDDDDEEEDEQDEEEDFWGFAIFDEEEYYLDESDEGIELIIEERHRTVLRAIPNVMAGDWDPETDGRVAVQVGYMRDISERTQDSAVTTGSHHLGKIDDAMVEAIKRHLPQLAVGHPSVYIYFQVRRTLIYSPTLDSQNRLC
jgi:hypothetical protein